MVWRLSVVSDGYWVDEFKKGNHIGFYDSIKRCIAIVLAANKWRENYFPDQSTVVLQIN